MSIFDRRPGAFQLFFVLLASLLMFSAIVNFYRYASSPTDENWFTDLKSNLQIIKPIPAVPESQYRSSAGSDFMISDSLRVGDILLEVNGKRVARKEQLNERLQALSQAKGMFMTVHRLSENRRYTYFVFADALPPESIREIPSSVYVFDVFEGGASDRAGMKKGDLIVRINQQALHNSYQADQILRRAQIGKSIEYQVLRGSRLLTLEVSLARFGFRLPVLIMLLAGMLYMGVGSFLALRRPQYRSARLLGMAFLLFGFAFAVVVKRDIAPDFFTYFRDYASMIGLFLGVTLWLHSSYYFPKKCCNLQKPWFQMSLYAIAAIFAILIITEKLTPNFGINAGILTLLLYHFLTRLILRKKMSSEYKKLNRYIFWSIITIIPLATLVQVLLFSSTNAINMGYIGLLYGILPLIYLYTIGRYRLMHLDLRVRKNIQYTLFSISWILFICIAALAFLFYLAEIQFDLPRLRFTGSSIEIVDSTVSANQGVRLERIVLLLFGIAGTFAFWKIGQWGQRAIDKKYFRTQHDYRRAASELAEVMASKLNMADLARGVVEKLAEFMHLKRVGVLFFRDEADCCCWQAHGFENAKWEAFCINVQDKMIEFLRRMPNEVRMSVEYMPAAMQELFIEHKFRHVIPIRHKDKLVGVLLVGEKLSESPFHQDDLELLASVARQASVAIENSFLYEELAEQERLKHELKIARQIQLASLPQATPEIQGLQISGVSIPASEVGGDYFDYLNGKPGYLTIIVGDVSGKGTSAALYMSKIQGIFRSLFSFNLSPRELFIHANQLLAPDMDKQYFVTALGVAFQTPKRKLTLARAGHLPLFHFQNNSHKVELITPKGLG
ncbi:MAG: PDZ domain-containing protein, partial [Calditrichaeota bacterium]